MAKAKSVKKAPQMPTPVEVTPEGMKWVYGAVIVKGDVIRMRVENPGHPKYGQYAYAVSTGGGFGCNPNALGNAIFVHDETFDIEKALSHKDDVYQEEAPKVGEDGKQYIEIFQDPSKAPPREPGYYRSCDGDRWERFWGIYTLQPV